MTNHLDTLTLYPSKRKLLGLLLVSILFAIGGWWLVGENPWMGYLTIFFFGLGALVFAFQLMLNNSFLRVDPDGLLISHFGRTSVIPWHDIERFSVIKIRSTGFTASKMVGITYADGHASGSSGLKQANVALTGSEGSLPDTYGMRAEALVDLLNERLRTVRVKSGLDD